MFVVSALPPADVALQTVCSGLSEPRETHRPHSSLDRNALYWIQAFLDAFRVLLLSLRGLEVRVNRAVGPIEPVHTDAGCMIVVGETILFTYLGSVRDAPLAHHLRKSRRSDQGSGHNRDNRYHQ